MVRSGTLVVCVQNLDFSGANQVVLNIVAGSIHHGNIVILSPRLGPLVSRFVDSGASVRVGEIQSLLSDIRDVFCIICNTIMTAPIGNTPHFYMTQQLTPPLTTNPTRTQQSTPWLSAVIPSSGFSTSGGQMR